MKRSAKGLFGVGVLWLAVAACSSSSTDSIGAGPPPTPPKPQANGSLEAFREVTELPVARGNHCAVAANGWLVVIGGNYKPAGAKDFVDLADVHVARIGEGGTLGEWKLAGKAPSAVNSCTAVADGSDIYLLDGIFAEETPTETDGEPAHDVRRATLGEDGTLGPWEKVGALPQGVRVLYSTADVANGVIRTFHALLPNDGDAIAMVRAPIAAGALGSFQETKWLPGFRGRPQYAVADTPKGSFVYALGGYAGPDKGNAMLATAAAARLDESGAPGPSFPVRDLPKPTGFGVTAVVDGWLFVVGGKEQIFASEQCSTCARGRVEIFAAPIAEDGTLGPWTTPAKLPQGRTAHAVVVSGEWLYVIGGAFDAGGVKTVWSTRVRYAAAAATAAPR